MQFIFKIQKTIMRNLFILFAVLFGLFSCQQNNSYQINGSVADSAFEGTTVYLQKSQGREMINIDSAVVSDGAFKFSGAADTVKILYLALDKLAGQSTLPRTLVVVEPGKINIKVDDEVAVSGTKLNNDYAAYIQSQEEIGKEIRTISEKFQTASQEGTLTDELREELMEEYQNHYEVISGKTLDFVKSNIGNELGKFMFLTNVNNFELDVQKEVLALADEKFKSDENIQNIISRIESAEKVAIGQQFADFTMKDTEGNDVSLSDYAGKGKVVLIDFWAAWCGPCRQEMPNVVNAYNKYKDKGFEVVGVSLDRNTEEWEKGIKELNMTWPQMSDLKFWETPVVELYAFRGIPHTVLLDGEGKIIEKDLRGKALDDKLEELLGS